MLLLILLGLSLVLYSSIAKVEVSATGTGIGIREDGPTTAKVGDTISYTITVANLGDYWDRNMTVTDKFPNGTSSSWNIPDLAPLLQSGHQFTISGIQYIIKLGDVLPQQPPIVVNNAKVTGYADVNGSAQSVQAEINFPTITLTPPVAIFMESDDHPVVNETVTFNASSSHAPGGQIIKFEWDWEGDGTFDFDAGTNPIATHAYGQPGIYYPTLRVTDNNGLTNETTERKVVSSSAFVVGGYSVSLETAYPQSPSIIYVILLLAVTAASACLHFKFKHVSISLNGPGQPDQSASADRKRVHLTIERFHWKKTQRG
jgi:uncharacterized repeat protein (TIGR01451 family)